MESLSRRQQPPSVQMAATLGTGSSEFGPCLIMTSRYAHFVARGCSIGGVLIGTDMSGDEFVEFSQNVEPVAWC